MDAGSPRAPRRADPPIRYPGYYVRIDVDTGAFTIGPLPPGRYHVKVSVAGFQLLDAGERSLDPDQVLDLGTLQLQR